jgi:transketolase
MSNAAYPGGGLDRLRPHFQHWEVVKDMIDQLVDLMLNFSQSGHPGGSRSKVYPMVVTALSGMMRWDIRHPEKRFADRFVLVGGHANPMVYGTLAVLNEAMRVKYKQTGDRRYLIANEKERALYWEDLLTLRRRGGLPGHAEMAGKTLFFKFNTGPSGHGSPAAAGEALALKLAGAGEVKVIAFEGEGGLTPGAIHETMNSAWGLGLNNLYYVVDWNDFGIDDRRCSEVVYGTPDDWFGAHGWRTFGAENGEDWEQITARMLDMFWGDNPQKVPSCTWIKTRKGRGYGKFDNVSHGAPHAMDCEAFWGCKEPFADKYGIEFEGFEQPAPPTFEEQRARTAANMQRVLSVLHRDQELIDYVANTLADLGDSVPESIPTFRMQQKTKAIPWKDERLYDYENYPPQMYLAPGAKAANRAGLAAWGAWVNAFGHEHYGRPLFIAMSADLAESTNIAGFAKKWGDFPGWGWYERDKNPEGALLPQEITEFANAGICVGMSSVNFSDDPWHEWDGFCSASSTYGSFAYLKYGMMRLYSQMAQDCPLKVGKVLWVAGHSGPETAEDSRTHFGIFSPGVGQLFPKGHVLNLHPWEYNEVPVVLGAAMNSGVPIIALHLTRPAIVIPDRKALGMESHFAAAKGAYLIRPYREGQKKMGTVLVEGTSSTANIIKMLPELDKAGLNVKIVAAISPELFAMQPQSYRDRILPEADWWDSMVITTSALRLASDWIANRVSEEYSMSSDWDNRWRTGGSVEEVVDEAHLSPPWILKGIERFALDREKRLARICALAGQNS